MTLYARLDTTRNRVLCGVVDCGTELAQITDDQDNPGLGFGRFLVFGPGWRPRGKRPQGTQWTPYGLDGVWELNRRGQGRRRYQGPDLTHRDRIARQQGDRRGRPLRPQDDRSLWGNAPWNLPIDAACPSPGCGMRQTMDPQRLEVDPHRDVRRHSVAGIHGEIPPESFGTLGPRVPGANYRVVGPTSIGAVVEWPIVRRALDGP
jgi:hypothetical protein